MYCYLALYLPKYTHLTNVPAASIILPRKCILILHRAALNQARLATELIGTKVEQKEYILCCTYLCIMLITGTWCDTVVSWRSTRYGTRVPGTELVDYYRYTPKVSNN
jgi:hypothetical protein